MPMWDFICEKCGKELPDVIVKLDEEPPPCPECGAATEKVTSYKTSFRLKGVSWARDGYKNRKQKR